jgi:hypothetical protein
VLEPASVVTTPDWGYRRVRIGARDVTWVRGVRTQIGQASWAEPYGEESLGLAFPAVTHWDLRAGTFPWLAKGRRVVLSHYDADMEFVEELGRWRITDLDVNGGQVTVLCQGEYMGRQALTLRTPPPFPRTKPRDIGRLIYSATRPKGLLGRRIPNIGITTTQRGSINQTSLQYLDELLDQAFDSTGQWTIGRHPTVPGRYQVRRKDLTGSDATITLLPGSAVTWDLRTDVLATPTAVYGQWETPDGRRGRNVVTPNRDDDRPTYNGPYSQGDSGEDIQIITRELWSQGYQDSVIDYRGADFTSEVKDAVEDAQANAGLSVTGVVNERTWNAIFAGYMLTGGSAQGARIAPLAVVDATSRFLRSSNGSVRGLNPAYDPRLIRVDEFIDYGAGVRRKQVVRHARRLIARYGPLVWFGSVTLDGVDPPEMHRLDIREGMNVTLVGLPGDPLAHVVKVTHSGDDSPAVTLEVDTAGRDARTVAALRRRERNPDAIGRQRAKGKKSQLTNDRYTAFDQESGAGEFRIPGQGGRWVVRRIMGGTAEGVVRINVDTTPNRAFVFALFGRRVTVKELNRKVGNPTAKKTEGGQSYDPFNTPSGRTWRDRRGWVEAWGRPGQLSGYSPGQQSDGHPITGNLRDGGLWHVESQRAPYLWAAVWVVGGDATLDGKFRVLDQP